MKNLFEIINVTGADRIAFLQGQFTQNIELLSSSKVLFGALCSPKGRVFATCQLFATKENIHIILPSRMTDLVIQRLNLYKLRANVFLERNNNTQLYCIHRQDDQSTIQNNKFLENYFVCHDLKKTNHMEIIIYGENQKSKMKNFDAHLNNEQWRAARIANGIVDIVPEISEKYTPHMLNLDMLKGVSFNKGCYIGQEIVARTEYIGKVKRRAISYSLSTKITSRDEKLFLDEKLVAIDILSISGEIMIALVSTSIANENLTYEGGLASPMS